jgi:hypothetical protein
LQGYGTQQFKGKNVNILSGWSEKIFEVISLTESGMDSFINKISSYERISNGR